MAFYSPFFLLAFLPVGASVYYSIPLKFRNIALCALNLLFYFFAAGKWFFVLPFGCVLVCFLARFRPAAGIAVLAVLFALCKAFAFLPLGISFFFFRAISFLADGAGERNPVRIFSYLLFFPTAAMGPITRYAEMSPLLCRPSPPDFSRIAGGILRFCAGLVKKLFFADMLLLLHRDFLSGSTCLSAAMALFSYTLYLYFDFSGYSDMALGCAAIFGFSLAENFLYPYTARSVGEFFRRWHISLGRWFRDYIYIPLGGSRHGTLRMLAALAAVWLLTALWHGTTACFLFWGAYCFLLVALEKLVLPKGVLPGRISTFLLISLGWIFFFSPNLRSAAAFASRLFCRGGTLLYSRADLYDVIRLLPFFLLCLVLATPLFRNLGERLWQKNVRLPLYLFSALAYILALSCIAAGGYTPFLYAAF